MYHIWNGFYNLRICKCVRWYNFRRRRRRRRHLNDENIAQDEHRFVYDTRVPSRTRGQQKLIKITNVNFMREPFKRIRRYKRNRKNFIQQCEMFDEGRKKIRCTSFVQRQYPNAAKRSLIESRRPVYNFKL